jgi:hypothetical protein
MFGEFVIYLESEDKYMKKILPRNKKQIVFALIFSLLLGLVSIDAGSQNVQAKSKMKLSKTKLTLTNNDSKIIKVKNTTQNVRWSISTKKYGYLDSYGKQNNTCVIYTDCKKEGSFTVTAKIGSKKLKCKVTVRVKDLTTTLTEEAATTPTVTPAPTPLSSPSEMPIPTSTPAPTIETTPSPSVNTNSASENFQLLKENLTQYGELDTEGNYLWSNLRYSDDKTSTFFDSITYYPNSNTISFGELYQNLSDGKVAIIAIIFDLTDITAANISNCFYDKDGTLLIGSTGEIIPKELSSCEDISFTWYSLNNSTLQNALDSLGKSLFGLGMQRWDLLMSDYDASMTMKNLGFTSYQF